MLPKQQQNKLLAEKIIPAMEKRALEAYYCETKEDALKKAIELIPEGSSIAWGGSETIKEIGLIDEIRKGGFKLIDRATATTQEEVEDIYRKAFFSDFYLMSANAITIDGKLINIDGTGNRVAAMIYGPKNVIVVVGINKLEMSEESAIQRVHNKASVPNTIRLNKNTPCSKTGICHDCLSDDCICCQTVVTRKIKPTGRIKVILVGESLGY